MCVYMYHPVIKDDWNGEIKLLVADVVLGECKDLGYGSLSCPNDDLNQWMDEFLNKKAADGQRVTPKRQPMMQVILAVCF